MITKSLPVDETGNTFTENAILKAKAYGDKFQLLTLADDSGLCIDALDGRPGIFSNRYASTTEERNQKILAELNGVSNRQAHYTCVIALYDPTTKLLHTEEGQVEGYITETTQGNGGFGYDPIFFCPELNKTFGEATAEEKNSVSHRARALEKLKQFIVKNY